MQIFEVWNNFWELKEIKKRFKWPHSTGLHIRPMACGAHGLAARLARWAKSAPGPAVTTTVAQPAHADATRAPGGHLAWDRHGGAATGVQPWDKVWEHRWG
jgi:hypothetical protein